MKLDKKIIYFALVCLILAGIIRVIFGGFTVDLMLKKHESININVGQTINMNDMKQICKNVFKDKKFVLRRIEVFNESVNINVESITNDEKVQLVNELKGKYDLKDLSPDDIVITSNSNVRIRDMITPYIAPLAICEVIILVYMYIRFIHFKPLKVIGKMLLINVITVAVYYSLIAILTIPFASTTVSISIAVIILEMLIYIAKQEKVCHGLFADKKVKE